MCSGTTFKFLCYFYACCNIFCAISIAVGADKVSEKITRDNCSSGTSSEISSLGNNAAQEICNKSKSFFCGILNLMSFVSCFTNISPFCRNVCCLGVHVGSGMLYVSIDGGWSGDGNYVQLLSKRDTADSFIFRFAFRRKVCSLKHLGYSCTSTWYFCSDVGYRYFVHSMKATAQCLCCYGDLCLFCV